MGIKYGLTECTCDFCGKELDPIAYCYELRALQPRSTDVDGCCDLIYRTAIYDEYIICKECLDAKIPEADDPSCSSSMGMSFTYDKNYGIDY